MSDGAWWVDDYNVDQTGTAPDLLGQNPDEQQGQTTYSPPGEMPPIDQFNFVPDPNAPGGYQNYGPGVGAPLDQPTFSNQTGTYPDANAMQQAIAAGQDTTPYVDYAGNATNQMAAYQAPPPGGGAPQGINPGMGGPGAAPATWAQNTWGQSAYSPGNNWYDPATGRHQGWGSTGAGTAGVAAGWGVPGFGKAPIQILQEYMAALQNPNIAPGYIQGSGTYNQFPLNEPGLFGTVPGTQGTVNLRYGLGGPGDPTTGLEPQTPDEWVQGPRLFNWNGMMGQGDLAGLGYIATLFGRSDTPSGIGTPAFSAPAQFWQGLAQAVSQGKVQPTARGWALLASRGVTPQSLGAGAIQQAATAGVGPTGGGVPTGPGATGARSPGGVGQVNQPGAGGQTGPMGPGSEAFNYQQMYLAYLTERMKQVEIPGMQNIDEREKDRLAFEKVKQDWLQKFQSNQTSLGYLGLQAQLRGPADIFQYLKVLNGTPGGIRDIVNAAAGDYRMPRSGGPQVTVGGGVNTGGASDLSALISQMNNPGYGAEAQGLNLPLPNQINAQNFLRMNPAQQQVLLAAYEAAGYRPEDVADIFQKSLPQYAGPGGAGQVNLFR